MGPPRQRENARGRLVIHRDVEKGSGVRASALAGLEAAGLTLRGRKGGKGSG